MALRTVAFDRATQTDRGLGMSEELTKIGFAKVGSWALREGEIVLHLTEAPQEAPVLYAFVVDDVVKYIGKTSTSLDTRMHGYANPGPTQTTNIKNQRKIKKELRRGSDVSIYVLRDDAGLTFRGYAVSLVDGLEPSLIYAFDPEWNDLGKRTRARHADIGRARKREEPPQSEGTLPLEDAEGLRIAIKLGKAYFSQGFFNIGVQFEKYFGAEGSNVDIYLDDDPVPIHARVDRHSNPNGTPRIMAGTRYRDWVQSNLRIGDKVQVQIQKDGSIRLGPPGE